MACAWLPQFGYLRHYGAAPKRRQRGYDRLDGRPAFVLPLGVGRHGSFRIACWLGGDHSGYNFGLWSREAVAEQDGAEVEAVEAELLFRLQGIERAARLRAGDLPADDAERLDLLCTSLRGMAPAAATGGVNAAAVTPGPANA